MAHGFSKRQTHSLSVILSLSVAFKIWICVVVWLWLWLCVFAHIYTHIYIAARMATGTDEFIIMCLYTQSYHLNLNIMLKYLMPVFLVPCAKEYGFSFVWDMKLFYVRCTNMHCEPRVYYCCCFFSLCSLAIRQIYGRCIWIRNCLFSFLHFPIEKHPFHTDRVWSEPKFNVRLEIINAQCKWMCSEIKTVFCLMSNQNVVAQKADMNSFNDSNSPMQSSNHISQVEQKRARIHFLYALHSNIQPEKKWLDKPLKAPHKRRVPFTCISIIFHCTAHIKRHLLTTDLLQLHKFNKKRISISESEFRFVFVWRKTLKAWQVLHHFSDRIIKSIVIFRSCFRLIEICTTLLGYSMQIHFPYCDIIKSAPALQIVINLWIHCKRKYILCACVMFGSRQNSIACRISNGGWATPLPFSATYARTHPHTWHPHIDTGPAIACAVWVWRATATSSTW